jgi:putative salt-induced outer membrane protein YdiY
LPARQSYRHKILKPVVGADSATSRSRSNPRLRRTARRIRTPASPSTVPIPSANSSSDPTRRPRLIDLWAGALDVGYATSQGNAKTSNLNVGAAATRATRKDKTSVRFISLFASSKTNGINATTANAKHGGISYSRDLHPSWFAFGSVDFDNDQFQSLDIRFAPAAGLGGHLIKTDATILDLSFGASVNREVFSTGLKRTSGEVLVGQEFTKKFSKTTSLQEKLVIYPGVTEVGEYRVNFDTSFATVLRRWLSWQLTVSDRLLSNPVPGRKKNDVLLTTGLRISFAR